MLTSNQPTVKLVTTPLSPHEIDKLVSAIISDHRSRVFWMEQRKRQHLALASFLRWQAATAEYPGKRWEEIPPAERKKIAVRTLAMCDGVPEDDPNFDIISGSLITRRPAELLEERLTKKMESNAKRLPVWKYFADDVKGFGARSLAVIVGEAGNLGQYSRKSKIWKRMGLAVINGIRQGGLTAGDASKEQWIEHGYNKKRRSTMYVIGESLLKQQIRVEKDGDGNKTEIRRAEGKYGQKYLDRKKFQQEKAVAAGITILPAATITKLFDRGKLKATDDYYDGQTRNEEARIYERHDRHLFMSEGHIHRRAQRETEKKLLADLLRAWKECTPGVGCEMPDHAPEVSDDPIALAAEHRKDVRRRRLRVPVAA